MNSNSSTAKFATVFFCVLVALCEGIDLQAAGVAAAGIGAEFKPNPDQFGNFFSSSTFGLFIGAVLGGWLADRIGRKKVLVTSIAVFGLFSLLTSFATDIPTLIGARGLTGLGLGGALPMLLALVTENSSAKHQSISVTSVYAAMPFGGAAASLLSLVMDASHWRVIFIVGGVIPLILAPLMALGLPESAEFLRVRQAPQELRTGSFFALFAESRALRSLLLWAAFFLELLLLYLLLSWLPTLLVTNGFSRVQAAGAQIGFNLGGVLSAVLIGYLLGGSLRNAAVIVIFVMLPILLVSLAKLPPEYSLIATVVFLLGAAVLAAQAFLYATAPNTYPTQVRGVGVGVAVAMGRIGSIVGPKLAGKLKTAGHGPSQLFMDLLPIVIVGSVCALWLAWEVEKRRVTATTGDAR